MNGVHDMGGMQDMGPIQTEKNEPVFHDPWEGRVFAMYRATGAWRKWNIDADALCERADSSGRIPAHELLRKVVRGAGGPPDSERPGHARGDRKRTARARIRARLTPPLTPKQMLECCGQGVRLRNGMFRWPRASKPASAFALATSILWATRVCRVMRAGNSARSIAIMASLFSRTPMPNSSAKIPNMFTPCVFPRASCGASRPSRRILSISRCGMTTLSQHNSAPDPESLAALPRLPRDEGGPVFAEPWEAQAFALAVKLSEQGHFTWKEWAAALADELKAAADRGEPDDGSHYYEHWLATLERLGHSQRLERSGGSRSPAKKPGPKPIGTLRTASLLSWQPPAARSSTALQPVGFQSHIGSRASQAHWQNPQTEVCATKTALPRNPARMACKQSVDETRLVAKK